MAEVMRWMFLYSSAFDKKLSKIILGWGSETKENFRRVGDTDLKSVAWTKVRRIHRGKGAGSSVNIAVKLSAKGIPSSVPEIMATGSYFLMSFSMPGWSGIISQKSEAFIFDSNSGHYFFPFSLFSRGDNNCS
jgi:hypothetical protein